MTWFVTRDGMRVSPLLTDEPSAFKWLLNHQPMSTDWAIEHEGYAIVQAFDVNSVPAVLIGEPVMVTFSDGKTEAGWLEAVTGSGELQVRHIDITGGGHMWTATYSSTGDGDTPHIVRVEALPEPAGSGGESVPLF
jgi:hypothetical protein